MIQRHTFLLIGSWPRLIDIMYWPTLNMLVWGFLNFYLSKQSSGIGMVAGVILGGAMLWDIMVRCQLSLFQSFMEELWSRNFGHVFISPMRPAEYALSLIIISMLRIVIAMTPCLFFAQLIFDFWLPGLGLPALGFAMSLAMSGWWAGLLLICLLFHFGYAAEWLAWMAMFVLSPIVGVYYPVTVLPNWLQHVAWCLPPTYVFEGLRALMNDHVFRADSLVQSFALNLLYLAVSFIIFLRIFNRTRRGKGLLQVYE